MAPEAKDLNGFMNWYLVYVEASNERLLLCTNQLGLESITRGRKAELDFATIDEHGITPENSAVLDIGRRAVSQYQMRDLPTKGVYTIHRARDGTKADLLKDLEIKKQKVSTELDFYATLLGKDSK